MTTLVLDPHITLGKIYSALAYYWGHPEALDADIQKRLEQVEKLRQATPTSSIVQKLKGRGVLSWA